MKKGWKIVLIILLVLLVLVGSAFAVLNHYLNKIKREDLSDIVAPSDEDAVVRELEEEEQKEIEEELEIIDGTELDEVDDFDDAEEIEEDLSWETIEPLMDDDLLNILLVGQDRRPGQGRQRSDSMILVSVNLDTKEISMISFMRDLYVQIPGGYKDNRLNVPYVLGGFPLLKEALMTNFGVSVDGCFEVDFDSFIAVIDLLGGVDMNLSQAEASIVGDGAVAGYNHLNGEQTLKYARIRKIDNDFGRTARQRKVLTYLFNVIKDSSLIQIANIADTVLPYLKTDLTNAQILAILAQGYKVLGGAELNSYRIPADDAYYNAMIRGMAVLVPDLEKCREDLQEFLPID